MKNFTRTKVAENVRMIRSGNAWLMRVSISLGTRIGLSVKKGYFF